MDRKRSWVWPYFELNTKDHKATCNLCKLSFAYKGTTSNLSNHLNLKHPSLGSVDLSPSPCRRSVHLGLPSPSPPLCFDSLSPTISPPPPPDVCACPPVVPPRGFDSLFPLFPPFPLPFQFQLPFLCEKNPNQKSDGDSDDFKLNSFVSSLPPGRCDKHFMPWKHPFTSLIVGPTGSGKSTFVKRFVQDVREMVHPVPDKIVWYYGEYQTMYDSIPGVEFREGVPDVDALDPYVSHLIIIDDLMNETNGSVTSLFTKKSHHRNISVMYLLQNLFPSGKEHRTISLNSQYIVLFKNARDVSQVRALGQQMYPGKSFQPFLEAYVDATSKPYGYLLLDLKQDTKEHLRLRTNVFPGEWQVVYEIQKCV